MKWWIFNNEVVSPAYATGLPVNFEEVEGVEGDDPSLVYFDGKEVVPKPERPSPIHVWVDNKWVGPGN